MLLSMMPLTAFAAEEGREVEPAAAKPTKITLNKSKLSLRKGEKATLKAKVWPSNASKSLKWTTSKKKVARVSAKKGGKAVVKAVGSGTATIKVTSKVNKRVSRKCTVKVAATLGGTYKDTSNDWSWSPQYAPKIKFNKDGTYVFTVNLYEGMSNVEGTYTRSGNTITCKIHYRSFKGFVGDNIKSFRLYMRNSKTLVYYGSKLGVTEYGDVFKK